jgi:hypothetical protein
VDSVTNNPVVITLTDKYIRIKFDSEYTVTRKVTREIHMVEREEDETIREVLKDDFIVSMNDVLDITSIDEICYDEDDNEIEYYLLKIGTNASTVQLTSSKKDRNALHKQLLKWKYSIDE